jgi:hypothetical protein
MPTDGESCTLGLIRVMPNSVPHIAKIHGPNIKKNAMKKNSYVHNTGI